MSLVCRYLAINDNEVYHFANGEYKVYDYTLDDPSAVVPAVLQTLEMEVAHIMKGGFDHFMQKEIHEQPESILQTMRGRLKFDSTDETVGLPSASLLPTGAILSDFRATENEPIPPTWCICASFGLWLFITNALGAGG